MNPTDILIKELDELEKDLARVKRNNGAIFSVDSVKNLDSKINDFKKAITILATHNL